MFNNMQAAPRSPTLGQMSVQQQRGHPDDVLVALFRNGIRRNPEKSRIAGREIFDDIEECEIRIPGSKDVKVFPAHEFSSEWIFNPYTGEQTRQTYAQRFVHQYRQFKEKVAQTKEGTPLNYVPFLTPGKQAELQSLNIYTLEALAQIDGQELKNIGLGGRELKNQAMEYLEQSKNGASAAILMAQVEAMRVRTELLEADNKILAEKAAAAAAAEKTTTVPDVSGDAMLDAMSDNELKDYIGSVRGARPIGNSGRKTLLRMALEARAQQVAAGQG